MEVEHVAGVGLAARGAAQQQRHGPVGHGVLAQVVIDHQYVLALVHKVLGNGAGGVGGQILHGRGVGRRGRHDDAAVHGSGVLQLVHQPGHGAGLLADGAVDADDAAVTLVEHGGDGDGGLAGLAVADDELPLAPANGDHGVDGQDAGLHGGIHGGAVHDGRSGAFHLAEVVGLEGLAVQGTADGVHHPAQQVLAHGHVADAAGASDHGARRHGIGLAQQGRADAVQTHIQGHAVDLALKFQQLAVLGVGQALHLDDAVLDGFHPPVFIGDHLRREVLQTFLEKRADGNGLFQHNCLLSIRRASASGSGAGRRS